MAVERPTRSSRIASATKNAQALRYTISMPKDLKQLVIDGFGGTNSQIFYSKQAENGLWISEEHFIQKYFTNKKGRLLDLGCGAGRTTMPLVKMGFTVTGIDIAPPMIESAKRIANQKGLQIDYQVGDAEQMSFADDTFDYVLFSNQGWTQIPGKEHRLNTLKEVRRVLKPGGIFIFTGHPRIFSYNFPFWSEQWVRFHWLKPLGFSIDEQDYGDRFFSTEPADTQRTYKDKQFIHFPTKAEVLEEIKKADFNTIEANGELQISKIDIRRYPPVLYIVQK